MLQVKKYLHYIQKCRLFLKTRRPLYRLSGFDEENLLLHMQYGSRSLLTRKIIDVVVEPKIIEALGSYDALLLGIIFGRLCLLERIDFNVFLRVEKIILSDVNSHFTIDRSNNIEYYDAETGEYNRILLQDVLQQKSLSVIPVLSFNMGLIIGRKRSFKHSVYL